MKRSKREREREKERAEILEEFHSILKLEDRNQAKYLDIDWIAVFISKSILDQCACVCFSLF